ncbi:MFS transporter [Pseudoclavibacter sp. CFCC 11306]|uniref:MFS transporter n=1 Tax=Pseudoclavibacter sp. CFCC 11306 TaxID=1564493 RepID=UPI0017883E5E|nr:MFS transporter [Pseudoclavibacter sp. CFCC 11306]
MALQLMTERSARPLWMTLGVVLFGTVLNPLDGSMTALALPGMARDLQVASSAALWAMTVYYLGSMAAQPVMGRIADLFGPRLIFIGGLSAVVVSCAGILVAPSLGWVVALRGLQAVGSAVAFPTGLVIVRRACQTAGSSADRAVGVITWVNSLAAAVGPLIGGLLVSVWGWRAPSALTLVAAAIAVTLAALVLRVSHEPNRPASHFRLGMIDLPGILLFVCALAAVQLLLTGMLPDLWGVLLGVAILSALLFVWCERHAPVPFIDARRLFRQRGTALILLLYCLANVVFFSVLTGLPTWLQNHRGLDAVQSGVVTFPTAVVGVAVTLVCGRLVYAGHQRAVVGCTAVSMAVGATCIAFFGAGLPTVMLAMLAVLMASPNNISTLALQTSLYQTVAEQDIGVITGVFQTCRYFGASLATSITALTVASTEVDAATGGLQGLGVVCAMAGVVALSILLILRPLRPDPAAD